MTSELCAVLHSRARPSRALFALVLAGASLLIACGGTPQATQDLAADPALGVAEKAFLDAVHKGDAAALGNLLDIDFVWISADGKTYNRADTLKAVPKPALADETGADVSRFTYSNAVETVTVSSGKMNVLRILAKRPDGWRMLVYQEVRSLDAAPAAAPSPGAACDNPCKSIPFSPQDDTQKAVASAYMAMESAAANQNAEVWTGLVTFEFLGASSNSALVLTKNLGLGVADGVGGRPTQLQNMAGFMPVPLVSATMEEFPGVVVMRSKHQPVQGNALEVTQVWIVRDDKWVITVNFQTAVQAK